MSYSDVVATIALMVSVVAVPASGVISYRYAIKGEKRKEWNALCEPLIESIEELHHYWSQEREIHVNHISMDRIEKIRRRMNNSERKKFDSLWSNLEQSIQNIKLSPAPLMWLADGSHKEPWVSPYPPAAMVSAKLLKILQLR